MAENIEARVVVDAAYFLAFLIPDERNEEIVKKFNEITSAKTEIIATYLLPFEIFNSLKNALFQKRITREKTKDIIKDFYRFNIHYEEIDFEKCLELALTFRLTVYDAGYLYLSKKLNAPLLTLDKDLLKIN